MPPLPDAAKLIEFESGLATTHPDLTDDEIVCMIRGDEEDANDVGEESDDEVEEVDAEPVVPSRVEVAAAFETLNRMSLFTNDGDIIRQTVVKLQNEVHKTQFARLKQSSIMSYYKKTL